MSLQCHSETSLLFSLDDFTNSILATQTGRTRGRFVALEAEVDASLEVLELKSGTTRARIEEQGKRMDRTGALAAATALITIVQFLRPTQPTTLERRLHTGAFFFSLEVCMPTSSLLLATTTRIITCSLCEGVGDVCTSTSGGSFHIQQEQWYPDEQTRTCPRCRGKGELEESFCLVCTHSASVCSCTDSEIDLYLLTSYLGAA